MHRPGPLQELPLELFLPPNPNLLPSDNLRPNKRPLSPGGPRLFSPAKRRILNEEGILTPEKIFKTPTSRSDWNEASARFTQVLSGPQSPAKVLDFGTPKRRSAGKESTPTRPTTRSITSLAASPELKSTSSRPDDEQEMDDYFSASSSSILPPHAKPQTPVLVTLPPIDTQSIHYPGFRVYRDLRPLLSSPLDTLSRQDDTEDDTDSYKENIAPLRKQRTVTSPQPEVASVPSHAEGKEKVGKARSTPKKIFGMDKPLTVDSPTSRRPLRGLQSDREYAMTPKVALRGRKSIERAYRGVALNVA